MLDRFLRRVLSFTSVGLFALLSARLVAEDRRYLVLVALGTLAFFVPAWIARRRMRTLLLSGDVGRIVGSWQASLRRVMYPETMAPLMNATAYAAYGFIDAARHALQRAARGPAWEAAVEQRLFVEALLDVYEGERGSALSKAEELEKLPLPPTNFWVRRKVSRLRRGIGAVARAFAHTSLATDDVALRRAGHSSPLVHWATRYARAIIAIDGGRVEEARALLADAPAWPKESAFSAFHEELLGQLTPSDCMSLA